MRNTFLVTQFTISAISGYSHQGQRTPRFAMLRRVGVGAPCPISAINAFPSTIARVHFAHGPVADLGTSPSHRRRTMTRVQHIRDWLTISLKYALREREREISTMHPRFVTSRWLLLVATIIFHRFEVNLNPRILQRFTFPICSCDGIQRRGP